MSLGHLAAKMLAALERLLIVEDHEVATASDETPFERLPRLLADVRWLKIARDGLADMKFEHRDALARWIPSMLADARLVTVIEHVAGLDVKRDLLEGAVIRLIKNEDPSYEDFQPPAEDPRREATYAVALWRDLTLDLVAAQEALMRATRKDEWRNEHGRRLLGPAASDEIEERVRTVRRSIG